MLTGTNNHWLLCIYCYVPDESLLLPRLTVILADHRHCFEIPGLQIKWRIPPPGGGFFFFFNLLSVIMPANT